MDEIVERFSFFRSFYESAESLPDEEKAAFYDYIMHFAFEGEEPTEEKGAAVAAFRAIRPIIENSIENIKQGKVNGKKGGAPKGNQNARKKHCNDTTRELNLNQADKEVGKEKDMDNEKENSIVHKENDERPGSPNINFNKILS